MKNGQCPRCDSPSIYTKRNGIVRVVTDPPCGVYIPGLSTITFPTDIEVYVPDQTGQGWLGQVPNRL